ncbi:MAG TPA: hypothetical protein VLU46_16935 [Thermoanaerobaculia bacterium]|nr:hypothetical protein [Thermoanaerobaculia bacterium]
MRKLLALALFAIAPLAFAQKKPVTPNAADDRDRAGGCRERQDAHAVDAEARRLAAIVAVR